MIFAFSGKFDFLRPPLAGSRCGCGWSRRCFAITSKIEEQRELGSPSKGHGESTRASFEEVALGYPRHWDRTRTIESYLREILPAVDAAPHEGPFWRP